MIRAFIIAVLMLLLSTACGDPANKTVLLQPYGDFSPELTLQVAESINASYGFDVYIASSKDIPQEAFVNIKSPRYRADSILKIQQKQKVDSIDFILGLTNKDISTTKRDIYGNVLQPTNRYEDWGVFGLGYRPGSSSIVSTFRMSKNGSKILTERVLKVCNHELGHNLGLPHCTSSDSCVLRDAAESIKTVDNVSSTLCAYCRAKI